MVSIAGYKVGEILIIILFLYVAVLFAFGLRLMRDILSSEDDAIPWRKDFITVGIWLVVVTGILFCPVRIGTIMFFAGFFVALAMIDGVMVVKVMRNAY